MKRKFSAEWIWNTQSVKNQHIEFVCPFDWNGSGKVVLLISSAANYAAYINGNFAASGQYHDFPEYKVYDEIDVTPLIVPGKNRLCVIGYAVNGQFFWHIADVPGIIFEIVSDGSVLAESQPGIMCRPARGYVSGELPYFSGQLGYSYAYDFTTADNWLLADAGGFASAVRTEKDRELFPRPVKRLIISQPLPTTVITQGIFINGNGDSAAKRMQTAFMAHRLINSLSDEVYKPELSYGGKAYAFRADERADGIYFLVDLGKETAGYLSFELELPEAGDIDIAYGEHLDDLRVRSEISGRNFAMSFKCVKGVNKFDDYMKRIGLRYLQVFVHCKSAVITYVGLRAVTYPLQKCDFKLSDSLHQRIYDVAVDTLALCMHEHYEDCPWREQCLYPMGTRLQMLCGYYAFKEYAFPKAALRLMSLRLRDDGNLPICSPSVLKLTIPVFSFVYITAVKEYLERTGDMDFAKELYPKCVTVVSRYLSMQKDGLLTRDRSDPSIWNFYDWTDGFVNNWGDHEIGENDVEFPAPMNAHFSIALRSLAGIADAIGQHADARKYSDEADRINANIDRVFWNESKGLYASYSIGGELSHYAELTQSLVLCCGAVSDERKARLLTAITAPNDLYKINLSMLGYKYDALLAEGDKYIEYVRKDIETQWGYMLYHGATSFWETIKGGDDFFYAGSLCHGWSALPVYIYHKYGLGLTEKKADGSNV